MIAKVERLIRRIKTCIRTGLILGSAGHIIFYFLHGVVVAGFQGAHAGAGYFGHLLVGHLVVVAQVEDEALLVGQAQNGFLELQLNLVAGNGRVGFDFGGQLGPHVGERQQELAPLAARKFRHSLVAMR